MARPSVAIVDAGTPGNVGTIARSMKNFGFEDLLLVDPPELDPEGEAYGYAGQAREDVLPSAREVDFDALVENYYTVATTAITGEDSRNHVRFPFFTPADLREHLGGVDADVCLVFGREDRGLDNSELERMDAVCSIPASEDYPVLNLGQAATIVLYELQSLAREETQLPDVERERASEAQIERLYDRFSDLLAGIGHTPEKRDKTMRMARRLFGRAHPTERETITLLGIFRRASEAAERDRERGTESDDGRIGDGDRPANDD